MGKYVKPVDAHSPAGTRLTGSIAQFTPEVADDIDARLTAGESERKALAARLDRVERALEFIANASDDGTPYDSTAFAHGIRALLATGGEAESIEVVPRPHGRYDIVRGDNYYAVGPAKWTHDDGRVQIGDFGSEHDALAIAGVLRQREKETPQ